MRVNSYIFNTYFRVDFDKLIMKIFQVILGPVG